MQFAILCNINQLRMKKAPRTENHYRLQLLYSKKHELRKTVKPTAVILGLTVRRVSIPASERMPLKTINKLNLTVKFSLPECTNSPNAFKSTDN
jgi:hypothetical protein